jgi:hypothetical protein
MATTPTDEERLLLPSTAAFSSFLSLGLDTIVHRRSTKVTMGVAGIGLFALRIATPFRAIGPRFASPAIASSEEISVENPLDGAVFEGVRLLGMEVQDRVFPGEAARITLCGEANATSPENLRAVVQIWTAGGQLIGQRENIVAQESSPSDLWRAGDLVRDEYRVPIDEHRPAMCRVTVRVMDGKSCWEICHHQLCYG